MPGQATSCGLSKRDYAVIATQIVIEHPQWMVSDPETVPQPATSEHSGAVSAPKRTQIAGGRAGLGGLAAAAGPDARGAQLQRGQAVYRCGVLHPPGAYRVAMYGRQLGQRPVGQRAQRE